MTYIGKFPDSKNPRRDLVLLVAFLSVLIGGAFLIQYRKDLLLKNHIETSAIVKSKSSKYRLGTRIYIEYTKGNEIVQSESIKNSDCYDQLIVGDSVRIKYSVESPEIVDFIDCNPINRGAKDKWWKKKTE